jgi:7,8-dihydroneopterin aldolase/epimerase/oxygenase
MADRIEIKGLQVAARVGVPDLERSVPQKLEVDLVLGGDFRELDDDLNQTSDYAAVSDWIRRECTSREFRLIESLADHLANGLLSGFPRVVSTTLTLRKFILPGTRDVSVVVTRARA